MADSITIQDLPTEVLVQILWFLRLEDLLAAKGLCHYFNETIKESILLQYKMEAEIAGVVDNPDCKLTANEKLEALRIRERAWATLTPRFTYNSQIPPNAGTRYDLTNGVYGRNVGRNHGSGREASVFTFLKLPSQEGIVPQWERVDLEHDILDFGMALDQDLVASVVYSAESRSESDSGFKIYLFQVSTGQYHKDAKEPIISIGEKLYTNEDGNLERPEDLFSITIEVVGRKLVVLFTSEEDVILDDSKQDYLFAFNWMTGEQLLFIAVPFGQYSHFGVLTNNVVIVSNVMRGSLDLWNIEDYPARDKQRLVCSLLLPKLNYSATVDIHSKTRSQLSESSSKPFFNDTDKNLIVIRLRMNFQFCLSFVVRRSVYLDLVSDILSRQLEGEQVPPTVLWKDWGEPNAGWLPHNVSHRWILTVQGQRLVSLPRSRDSCIYVREYNPYRVRKMLAMEESSLPDNVCVVTDQPAYAPGTFKDKIIPAMPYVEYKSEEEFDYSGVIIDEERIIGIRTDYDGTTRELIVQYMG